MERIASRQITFARAAGPGLAVGTVILMWRATDHATANYGPLGAIQDPVLPWVALYAAFGMVVMLVAWLPVDIRIKA